jgi:hypothetical protein
MKPLRRTLPKSTTADRGARQRFAVRPFGSRCISDNENLGMIFERKTVSDYDASCRILLGFEPFSC